MTRQVDYWKKIKTYFYNMTLEAYLFGCSESGLKPNANDFFEYFMFKLNSNLSDQSLEVAEKMRDKMLLMSKKMFINDYPLKKLKSFVKKTWKGKPEDISVFLKEIEELYLLMEKNNEKH